MFWLVGSSPPFRAFGIRHCGLSPFRALLLNFCGAFSLHARLALVGPREPSVSIVEVFPVVTLRFGASVIVECASAQFLKLLFLRSHDRILLRG
jgi:hypothetical protein